MINYGKVLKIKIKILLNLFNVKYGLKVGEFNNTLTGTERVKVVKIHVNLVSNTNYNLHSFLASTVAEQD